MGDFSTMVFSGCVPHRKWPEFFWLVSGEAARLTPDWLILTRKWNSLLWLILRKTYIKLHIMLNLERPWKIRAFREVYHFISAQQRHLNQEPSSNLFFVNILDGNECYKKMKLFPKVEHGQIFVGSLFEWNENIKGLWLCWGEEVL